jgi:hypothetical protein
MVATDLVILPGRALRSTRGAATTSRSCQPRIEARGERAWCGVRATSHELGRAVETNGRRLLGVKPLSKTLHPADLSSPSLALVAPARPPPLYHPANPATRSRPFLSIRIAPPIQPYTPGATSAALAHRTLTSTTHPPPLLAKPLGRSGRSRSSRPHHLYLLGQVAVCRSLIGWLNPPPLSPARNQPTCTIPIGRL